MRPNWLTPFWIDVGVLVLLALTLLATVLVAMLIWRDGFRKGWRRSRGAPPRCPNCGYSMVGLTECRCPECGTTYRLETLWQSAVDYKAKPAANNRGDRTKDESVAEVHAR